jgi:thioredoxin
MAPFQAFDFCNLEASRRLRFPVRTKVNSSARGVMRISQHQFQREVMRSKVPVIVDFYADWCMPCKSMASVLQKVALQLAGRAKVVKVDVDEDPGLASAFRVSSIPALVVLHKGKIIDKGVGILSSDRLLKMVQKATSKP